LPTILRSSPAAIADATARLEPAALPAGPAPGQAGTLPETCRPYRVMILSRAVLHGGFPVTACSGPVPGPRDFRGKPRGHVAGARPRRSGCCTAQRLLRRVRPSHALLRIDEVHLVNVTADRHARQITWEHLARIPLGAASAR